MLVQVVWRADATFEFKDTIFADLGVLSSQTMTTQTRFCSCAAGCRPHRAGGHLRRVYSYGFITPPTFMHKLEFLVHDYAHAARFPLVVVSMALASLFFGLLHRNSWLMLTEHARYV